MSDEVGSNDVEEYRDIVDRIGKQAPSLAVTVQVRTEKDQCFH